MKVCEACGGLGHTGVVVKVLCAGCKGTGLITLGYESKDRHDRLAIMARARAIQEGWLEEVWERAESGGFRKARRPIERDVPVPAGAGESR